MKAFQKRVQTRGEGGFTLIELLVVIAILGILAAVVVFAVGGIGDKGQLSACKIDVRTLKTAEEAYSALPATPATAPYTDAAGLVAARLLDAVPTLHTITFNNAATPPTYSVLQAGATDGKCLGLQDTSADA